MYNALVDVASQLSGVELYESINDDCIHDATKLLERIESILELAQGMELHKCVVPVVYESDFFSYHIDELQCLRNFSRVLWFAMGVEAFKHNSESVAKYGMLTLDVANAVRRGGLVPDYLVSVAIAGCGLEKMRKMREHFSHNVRLSLISALVRYETEREPLSVIQERDAQWEAESRLPESGNEIFEDEMLDPDNELSIEEQRIILQFVREVANQPKSERQEIYAGLESQSLALTRLLFVDLAIRCWRDGTGGYPSSLYDLAPTFLPVVPRDPFTGGDFIYRPTESSFLLYSTGPDKMDGGGRFGTWHAVAGGGYDLCLDFQDYQFHCS